MRPAAAYVLMTMVVVVALVVAFSDSRPFAHPSAASGEVQGDVNCTNGINSVDALLVLRHAAALPVNAPCMGVAGNTNCDAAINAVDALRILRYAASLANSVPAGCTPIGQPIAPEPPELTTIQLIDEAVTAGEISAETGLIYKVYAEFGGDGLPPEYVGAAPDTPEIGILHEVGSLWGTLSAPTKDALAPYFLPPPAPGGWYEAGNANARIVTGAPIAWSSTGGSRVKVWWHTDRPEDEPKAIAIRDEVENYIWDKLVGLMGPLHPPLSDWDKLNNGGDERYDIYLIDMPSRPAANGVPFKPLGYVSPYDGACEQTSTYMAMNHETPVGPNLFSTVAHELFHSIQFSYDMGPCAEYSWLMESTSTWAEHFTYPNVNSEHPYGTEFLPQNRIKSLDYFEYGLNYQYGAYLFFFFIGQEYSKPGVVRDIWENATMTDSLAAVNAAIAGDGGFEDTWPLFAIRNYNREPVEDYKQWDNLATQALAITGQVPNGKTEMEVAMPHLAEVHYRFTVPDNIRAVVFNNTLTEEEGAHVWAIARIAGQWQDPEDWSEEEEKTFCRDLAGQDLQELVVIVTNTNWQNQQALTPAESPSVEGDITGCEAWEGSASATVNYLSTQYTVTVGNIRFEPQTNPTPTPGARYEGYDLVSSGPIVWQASGMQPPPCVVTGQMNVATPQSGEPDAAMGAIVIDRDEDDYTGSINGHNLDARVTITCPDSDPVQLNWPVIPVMQTNFIGTPILDPDTDPKLEGSHTDPSPVYGGTWEWSFHPAK
jgi:hypothetical protein